jgi:hypothetical protein
VKRASWPNHEQKHHDSSSRSTIAAARLNHDTRRVRHYLKCVHKVRINRDLETVDKTEYAGIVHEVYAVVSGAGRAARVETFNGNYGLLRGLAAAFLALIMIALVLGKGICVAGALAILLALAIQRMHRVSVRYATELFTHYLLLSAEPSN